MTLLLIHALILSAVSYRLSGCVARHPADRLIGSALLFWGHVVLLSLVLSCFGKLGNVAWYFRVSMLLSAASLLVAWRLFPAAPEEPADTTTDTGRSTTLLLAAAATLIPLVLANGLIAGTYEPCNYDSLTYHLPRSIYYIGHGSLQHFETADFRQVFYPFDFNLLQLTCFLYEAPTQLINFLNLAAWLLVGLSVYRVSRLIGGSRDGSLVAAWLALTSTEIMAQATSTNIDLPSASALLMCLVFVFRWHRAHRGADAGVDAHSPLPPIEVPHATIATDPRP